MEWRNHCFRQPLQCVVALGPAGGCLKVDGEVCVQQVVGHPSWFIVWRCAWGFGRWQVSAAVGAATSPCFSFPMRQVGFMTLTAPRELQELLRSRAEGEVGGTPRPGCLCERCLGENIKRRRNIPPSLIDREVILQP